MEIDYNKLDKLLAELYKGDRQYSVPIGETYFYLFPTSDRTNRDYASYMAELKGLGLAEDYGNSGTVMRITSFGRKVHKSGGWMAYQQQIQQAQQRETELREKEVNATVDSANSSNSSKKAAWVSAALTLSAFILSGLQYLDSQKKDEAILKLERQFATTDSLLKRQYKTTQYLDSVLRHANYVQSIRVQKK